MTAYEIVSRDWSSDVCSSDLVSAHNTETCRRVILQHVYSMSTQTTHQLTFILYRHIFKPLLDDFYNKPQSKWRTFYWILNPFCLKLDTCTRLRFWLTITCFFYCLTKAIESQIIELSTELEYIWNRNTAVLLYNQLSDHGEQKLFAHMINCY